ncbi:MAG: type II toxin-antitoxin system RelE/ParE family toxin [Nitrospira sp.]|nr:type II toxin-antitoxin system RelE/ParE family toxin [Nitrospira sp.]MCP9462439.1 type II toxin-antitoxin system RelE/ParE family toxin [Nitrospira sp.]MCP9473651.1 type II toxin-antitoxin system RelE/ParE family toxin [Nitrospira sp.]
MKGYRARYTREAAERIRKLHPQVKGEIKQGVKDLVANPLAGHVLQYELAGLRSYRVRTYRIIYRIHDEEGCLDIVFIGPRRDVYEQLRELLIERCERR